MARRKAKIYPRTKEEVIEEYRKGILDLDRPTWKSVQARDMETRYALITDELNEVREKAKQMLRAKVGTALVPNYLRAVLKAWRLAKLGEPERVYRAELNAVIEKNHLDRNVVNQVLKELGLPTIGA